MDRVVLAFSGGVDSTFLLKISLDILGKDNVLAVIAKSESFPKREYNNAKALAQKLTANFITIKTKETDDRTFIKNPVNRCYYCKKELFKQLNFIARKKGFNAVIDGFNRDDKKDFRYGKQAARELGIRSPLAEAQMGKREIRCISRRLRLPTWNKPSFACLATRFPYHHGISKEKLRKIENAEELLHREGFGQIRVRAHDEIARIELSGSDIKRLSYNTKRRRSIVKRLKQIGFLYITLDLEGYRTGSMNEVLRKNKNTNFRK